MSKPFKPAGQQTNIVNARGLFTYDLYGAMRKLGLHAYTQRRRIWIQGNEAHYFDLADADDLARFEQWRAGVLLFAKGKRRR